MSENDGSGGDPQQSFQLPPKQASRSRSIHEATEQVLRAAVQMERSDSVLIGDDEDDDSSMDLDQLQQQQHEEDEPSVEAMLSKSMRKTEIVHAQRMSSAHSVSSSTTASAYQPLHSRSSITSGELLGDEGEFTTCRSPEDALSSRATSPSAVSETEDEADVNGQNGGHKGTTKSPAEIMELCAELPLSLVQLYELYRVSESEDDIVVALRNARSSSNTTPESHPRDGSSSATTQEQEQQQQPSENEQAIWLHSIFSTFCEPPPSLTLLSQILEMETQQDRVTAAVDLPQDVLIDVSSKTKASVVSLLQHPTEFLQLPTSFQLAFFRILIRLLTNETDAEHNQECFFACDFIEEDDDDDVRPETSSELLPCDEAREEIEARREILRRERQQSLFPKRQRQALAAWRSNQLYTIVRFCSGTIWKQQSAVTVLLHLFSHASRNNNDMVLAPVARLLGLCATAGVQIKELRTILVLAGRPLKGDESGWDRLLLVRALSTAAEGAFLVVGKAGPRYFFSFGLGHGLARTFSSISNWPFRNDFGMAVWFRMEHYSPKGRAHYPKLFSARTHDGGGIEVSLTPLSKNNTNRHQQASIITVTVFDSQANGKEASEVHQVKLKRCVLLPEVWYHVAIRHTRSRLKGVFSMSSRQQISIMLDGKIMLTESLKFPKITMSDIGMTDGGLLRGRRNAGQHQQQHGSTMTIQCGANFEGQTGAFYIFNDNVSDGTLRALYDITGGTDGVIKLKTLEDSSWDERQGDIAVRSHALSVEITKADAEEIVLSSHENDLRSNMARSGSSLFKTSAVVADMGDGEGKDESDLPAELSRAALGSKLFIVWNPKRVEDTVAIELHSGAHVRLDAEKVQAWHVEGAKSVIASIGGVQALLPVFRELLSGSIERRWPPLGSNRVQDANQRLRQRKLYVMVPSLLSLLASFLRDHGENAREMLRCGGIDIIEQFFVANKLLGTKSDDGQVKDTLVSVLTVYPGVSRTLVKALLDVRSACSHYTGLDAIVFSRLLFNFQLWFTGPSQAHGVALYATLLPVLSTLAKTAPRKVRDCVGVRPMMELLREYVSVDNKELTNRQALTAIFDRSRGSGIDRRAHLTISERRHIVDTLFAMVSTLLASGTLPDQLQPLLNYISYNVDIEWEQASKDLKDGGGPEQTRTGTRVERFLTNIKAATVLVHLLQVRPDVTGLIESFATCCGSEFGAAGWILSCLVNTFDDEFRSIGLRCLSAYLDKAAPGEGAMLTADVPPRTRHSEGHSLESPQHMSLVTPLLLAPTRFTDTLSNVGKDLADVIGNSSLAQLMPSSKVSVKVVYKLLWHLLKCHRERSNNFTHAALLHILLEDGEFMLPTISSMEEFVVRDEVFHYGYKIKMVSAHASSLSLASYSGEKLRNTPTVNTVLRLLRFLPARWRREWLGVFVEIVSANRLNVGIILSSPEWQPPLFHLVSDVAEELATTCALDKPPLVDADDSYRSDLESSFNLSFKLYANVLGHCFRHGGEQALQILEQAASLERTCINGHEIVILILNHLLSDLNTSGTIDSPMASMAEHSGEGNGMLRQGARLVSNAILANGNDGFDATSAVKQWRCLRHLTAVVAAVVTRSGFGVTDLFDYRNQHASSLDELSGGLYGIRLSEYNIGGMTADDYVRVLSLSSKPRWHERGKRERDLYRHICVMLSSQILSLLDSFIFPESLDASLPASQLHGLALVRSNEPRLGFSQGPILASLVRLSLVLLGHLEPSSVKFLQCCSRLRCFVHWMLELIRESVSLAGYSAAFDELTAPLDRLLLATVLQCHRALARCASVLAEIEAAPYSAYFPSEEVHLKNYKRVLRVALELREIVLAAFRGRNEVLRASLSPKAFTALQSGLETNPIGSKEAVIRAFLSNLWVADLHDVDLRGPVAIPAQLIDAQDSDNSTSSKAGVKAIEAIAAESTAIIADFNRTMDVQFEAYCQYQKQWADTDAVRDLEYEGDNVVQRLSAKHRNDFTETARQLLLRAGAAQSRFDVVERNTIELWEPCLHWKLAEHTDRLNRRILLVKNRAFDDHHDASYELMLTKEREKAERAREERERRKQEEELAKLVNRHSAAFVPYGEIGDADEENFEDDDEAHPTMASESNADDDGLAANGETENEATAGENGSLEDMAPILAVESNDDDPGGGEKQSGADVDNLVHGDAWAKTFIWSSSESVVARFDNVSVVTLQTITGGRLLLTTHGLYFLRTGDVVSVMTKQVIGEMAGLGPASLRWRLGRLMEVHGRRFMLRPQALELFFSDSHELFLNFSQGTRERDRFYAKLRNSCKVPLLWSLKSLSPRTVFRKSQLTQLWRKRKISNFRYIMELNKMAGRTFNDITQYPVFPWIIADYKSEELDLSDSRIYRDLSKPVGALNPDRLSQLIERYKELESFGFEKNERFLYGSHYSSPGVVLHYMLRQEPFTTMAIELQSGRFDCPDRLFFDVAGCWDSCMTSSSDVKELVPEFFTCPDIFLNTNNFPLGSTQAGRVINHVGLPPWAKGSAYEFVRVHRLALESDFVSKNLHHWIDLIFGFKQRGPEAEAAHNVFHYLSYEGAVDLDKITDEVDRQAAESHIQNFGQTPCQLLVKEPHPIRNSSQESWRPLFTDMTVLKHLRCHTPVCQFGGKHSGVARGGVASIHVMTDSILVIYADMSLGSYKWQPKRGGKHPFSFKMDKHKLLTRRELSTSRSSMKRGSATPPSMDGGHYAVGSWSFGVTVGGQVKENLRRKEVLTSSRLSAATETVGSAEASSLIVSCGYWDDTVKVHSLDGSELLCKTSGGHRGPIRCLAIAGDGGLMVTGGDDGTCRVWLVDHPDMAIALSDGYVQTALGASNDGEQLLSCCHVLWGHQSAVTCVALSSDLDIAVSGSLDGTICVHTVRRGNFIRSIKPQRKGRQSVAVRRIVLDAHGTFVAHTEDTRLHSFTINGVFLCREDTNELLHDMKITSNGEVLVTGGDKGRVVLREVRDLHVLSMLDLSRHGPIRCISFTPEELNPVPQVMFIGSDDGLITVVDRETRA